MRRLHAMLACLLLLCIGSAGGLQAQESCSSSCGKIQEIRYPFRLKGDPQSCGDPNYELSCDGNNRAIMDYLSGKYYVQTISYENKTIRITDIGLASGGCGLPSHSLSFDTYFIRNASDDDPVSFYYPGGWASFVNCTRRIHSNGYLPVPCLSGNDTFVYVVFQYGLAYLVPSCSYLAMVPADVGEIMTNTQAQLFELLRNGFLLSWESTGRLSFSRVIRNCFDQHDIKVNNVFDWIIFPNSRQEKFLSCLEDYTSTSYAPYRVAIVVAVLINSILLLVLARVLGRLIFAPLAVSGFLAYKFWKSRVPMDAVEIFLRGQQALTPTRYAYTDIITMTRHFKEKLGQGGFGSVYKGQLPDGFPVAVKIMLGNSKCNGDDFISEVSTIGTIHHVNVVRLIGYSSEVSKRALVYEYLPKGSLEKYIFSRDADNSHRRPFTWDKLNDIALGVARGIDYLHRGCDMRILHFDIKPHNILLDNDFNPKVSDFGLAKLYPKDYSVVSMSAARGTIGYIAPELISRSFGMISYKSDVYSFGMLLLEMAGGRRNVEPKVMNTSQTYYPSWIYDQLTQIEVPHDNIISVTPIGESERKLCIVGLWCIQAKPYDRPSMSKVVEMLEADMSTLQMPPKPFFSSTPSISIRESSMESSSIELSIISEHDIHL